MPRRSRELVIPDVPAEGQTPRRSRAAKTPITKTPSVAEATPIRRSLRSQSVLPTPSATSTPKLPAKATPKGTPRANSRAPSASPARKPAAKTPASAQKKKSPASSPAPARPQSVAKTENKLEFKAPPPVVKVPAEENVFKAPPPKVIKGEVLDSRRAMSVSSIHSATVLFDWFIQFHPNQVKKTGALPPFYITGTKRTNGAQPLGWNTSPIVRVDEGANQFDWTFYTSSGNQYKISGRVNVREMAEQQIFPMEVAKAFEFGFPSNWLELLWNVFNAYRDKGFKKPLLAPRHTESDGNESVRSGQVNVNQTVTHAKSQRGRSLYTPLEHSFKMPQLSAERGGGERIKQKKRSIKYASSDDDDDTDAFMKTLRMSRYNYDSDHGPAGKRARRSNTGDLTADMRIIKNIQKRKAKLTREIAELDEYMFQVANKIDRKRREEKRLEDLHRGWEQQQPPRQRSRAGSELSSRKRKFQPIYEESESSSESSDEDSEDELKALSDSTSTDCDDGGDWRQARLKKNKKKFVPPPTNNNRRSKEKANIFEEENKTSESEEEDETEEIPKPKKEKKRKWTQEDLTRLKHVVSHVKVRKEEDWQKIANTMGQEFKAEDCKDMAVKRLNWKAPKEKTSKPEEEAMVITTRPGTLGHAIQAGEECRKYLLGAGSQELDGFRRQAMDGEDDEQDIVANIAELDPDDSILEALKTPKLATASFKKSKNRTDQPFLPTLFADEDTPKTNGRKSLALEEPTTAKREENLRYLHEINRTDRSRLNNTTRMNMSTTNYSMIDRSRAADQVARKMDKITKTVRDQIPKRKPTSDVDEEDEEEM